MYIYEYLPICVTLLYSKALVGSLYQSVMSYSKVAWKTPNSVVITASGQNVAQVPSFIVSTQILLHCWLCRSFRMSEVLSILSAFSYHCNELGDTKITCPSR